MNILFSNKLVKGLMTGLATMLLSLFTITINAETTAAQALSIDAPIGATQEAATDHSAKSKTMLFCVAMASNDQECKFYYNVLIGIDGVVHPTLHSSAAISAISITPSASGSSFNVGGTIGSESGQAAVQAESFVHSEVSVDQSNTMLPINGIDSRLISSGIFEVEDRDVKVLTGDLTVCFDSASTAAASYDGTSVYAANTGAETVKTITGDASDTDRQALILLGGWNLTKFNRSVLGYANLYTLAYTTTVVSNTTTGGAASAGDNAAGCGSEG